MDITNLYKSKITILHGRNGCGKTRILNKLKDHLSKDNVIFFSHNRVMHFSRDDIDSIDTMCKLNNKHSFKDRIQKVYDINDDFALDDTFRGCKITCGYIQLINFFYTIYTELSRDKSNIVIIDNIELNLHPLVLKHLIYDIVGMFKVDKLIISTHSNYLISSYETLTRIMFYDCKIINVEDIANDMKTILNC